MIYPAVFMLSFSSLAFEILLTRIFSISQWNHLSFMVISIALFGFACSGTWLALLKTRGVKWEEELSKPGPVSAFITLYSSAILVLLIVLNLIPLDYFKLPVEPVQALYIFFSYLMLAFPFFICGVVFAISYASVPEKTGVIYFFSMAGSAAGAVTPMVLIPFMGEEFLAIAAGLSPLVLIPFFGRGNGLKTIGISRIFPPGSEKLFFLFLASLSIIVLALTTGTAKGLFKTAPSHYKALSQILKFPESRIEKTSSHIRGRLDTVSSRYLRHAPGLSIKYQEILPNQHAVYTDGDTPLFIHNKEPYSTFNFPPFTLEWAGYHIPAKPQRVLIILKGGGISIPCAIASGAENITLVSENPGIAGLIEKNYGISVISRNPRSFLAGHRGRFDIIHIDNRGSSLPGASALDQDYSFTVQAFISYLSHLNDKGRLIIARKLILPPSDSVRMWATAYEGLKTLGAERPENHIGILRNWGSYLLIASPSPLDQAQLLETFAGSMNFDLVWVPGITPEKANLYNVFDAPYYFNEIRRLSDSYRSGTERLYFKQSLSEVSPQSDNRPFPYKHLKWMKAGRAYKTTGSRPYSLFLSGEIVILVVFLEAVLISVLLLTLPLIAVSKQDKQKTAFSKIGYFFWVGAGFMFVELYFIKQYILLFGNPVISVTFVLAGILVASGVGGIFSQKLRGEYIRHPLFLLIGVLFLYFLNWQELADCALGYSENFRFLAGAAGLIIPGVLMGFPFTLGMRWITKDARERAYAWAANGCASVLTAILSAHIALNFGISAILFLGIIAYTLAGLCLAGRSRWLRG